MERSIKLLIILIIVVQGCNTDDCGECFTPPVPFAFELVDKVTRENLFTRGTYASDQLTITDLVENKPVAFTFITEDSMNLIMIHTIGWRSEKTAYSFCIGSAEIFTLYVEAQRLQNDCCSYTRYKEIKIENPDFEFDSITGIYRILI